MEWNQFIKIYSIWFDCKFGDLLFIEINVQKYFRESKSLLHNDSIGSRSWSSSDYLSMSYQYYLLFQILGKICIMPTGGGGVLLFLTIIFTVLVLKRSGVFGGIGIRNARPVRFQFNVLLLPGILWKILVLFSFYKLSPYCIFINESEGIW